MINHNEENAPQPGRKSRRDTVSGLILLDKTPGLTSFDALAAVKKAIASGKAGHTGTLDKFAGGLLLVLTGRALKLSQWFSHCDKQYEGTIRFGAETDTLDPEGRVIAEAALPSREAVLAVLPQFTGGIMQAPPVYSAIHINGQRASALARGGIVPQMRERPVSVFALELRAWEPPDARVFVHCSSGTYIRSLTRDIALAAGSRAHLHVLTRTKVAGFTLEEADGAEQTPRSINKAVFQSLELPWFEVESRDVENIIHGKALSQVLGARKPFGAERATPNGGEKQAAGVFCGDEFIAMLEKSGAGWKYGYVYAGT